jgi:exosortase A
LSAAVGTVSILAIHHKSILQMVGLWWDSAAYNHALLIPPIVAYLIWDRRHRLYHVVPRPAVQALVLIPVFGAAWWVAGGLGIDEGQHFAVVAMLQGVFLAVFGWRAYRALLFPFLYLFLTVPTGEYLLEPLQQLAVVTTVFALRLTGIAVYSEGTLIEVPTGAFDISEGCAGLNFLLAALALSLLFANLLYAGWTKRVICVAIALAAAIVVNWIRIYGIIAIDYATGHTTGIAEDHLFYGWIVFTIVMFGLIAVAQAVRDKQPRTPVRQAGGVCAPVARPVEFGAVAVACIVLAGIFPAAAAAGYTAEGIVPSSMFSAAVTPPSAADTAPDSPARPAVHSAIAGVASARPQLPQS